VEAEVRASGFPFQFRSRLDPLDAPEIPVIILDTHGELATAYRYATIAFVGGSLAPIGGHNILEPAYFGVPVLYGPFVDNFAEEVELVDAAGAGSVVADAHSLTTVLHDLLEYQDRLLTMGEKGRQVLQNISGILDQTYAAVTDSLDNAE